MDARVLTNDAQAEVERLKALVSRLQAENADLRSKLVLERRRSVNDYDFVPYGEDDR